MDRQKFSRLVFEKLSILNPISLNLIDESDESLTIEIISNNFVGLSALKRINKVYQILANDIQAVDFHVDFITLTENESKNGSDEQKEKSKNTRKVISGYAAQSSL